MSDGFRRTIFKNARSQGWQIQLTNGGHVMLTSPEGLVIVTSATPSDHRAVSNMLSRMRQLGFSMPNFQKPKRSPSPTPESKQASQKIEPQASALPKKTYRIRAIRLECVEEIYRLDGLTFRVRTFKRRYLPMA